MLKHLISAMLAVTSVSVATAAISGVKWDQRWDAQTQTLIKAQGDCAADWMADLPDNMFVAHVSIPAAHDFATGENNWKTTIFGWNRAYKLYMSERYYGRAPCRRYPRHRLATRIL